MFLYHDHRRSEVISAFSEYWSEGRRDPAMGVLERNGVHRSLLIVPYSHEQVDAVLGA